MGIKKTGILLSLFLFLGIGAFAQTVNAGEVWTGNWQTQWDTGDEKVDMNLTQSGTTVTGFYAYNEGRIEGVYDPKTRVLLGVWTEADDRGWIRFVLSGDKNSFAGEWGDEGEEEAGGSWWGDKIKTLPPLPPVTSPGPNAAYPEFDTGKSAVYLTDEEKKILYYLNFARVKPAEFAEKFLLGRRKEGSYAEEAYQELRLAKSVGLLKPSRVLTQAAVYHVKDQGPSGKTGHDSSNGMGMSDRIEKYGEWRSTIGENISYGYNDALGIVLQLLIDDGVVSRGHRKNILNKNFNYVGISIGTHKAYRYMCVQDFAGGIAE